MNKSLGCVIVTYNPDVNDFIGNLNKYASAFDEIIVVDNSSNDDLKSKLNQNNLIYIPLYKNTGIANAQNVGIKKIINKVDEILFFDQDSYMLDQDIIKMSVDLNNIKQKESIASISPTTKENVGSGISFVDEVISSGTLIPTNVLKNVGFMDDKLFIEFVDYEWCWRAIKKGYKIAIDNDIPITHQTLNEAKVLGRDISSPTRTYYYFRNITIIFRNNLFLSKLKNKLQYKVFKHIIFELVFCNDKKKRFSNMVKGFKDGKNGITGKINNS